MVLNERRTEYALKIRQEDSVLLAHCVEGLIWDGAESAVALDGVGLGFEALENEAGQMSTEIICIVSL